MLLYHVEQHVLARLVESLDESGRLRMSRRREHWTALESTQQFLRKLTAEIGAVVADDLGGNPTLVNNSINASQTARAVTDFNENTVSRRCDFDRDSASSLSTQKLP